MPRGAAFLVTRLSEHRLGMSRSVLRFRSWGSRHPFRLSHTRRLRPVNDMKLLGKLRSKTCCIAS